MAAAVNGTNWIAAYHIAHLQEGFIERAFGTHLGTGTFQTFGAGFEPLLKTLPNSPCSGWSLPEYTGETFSCWL